MKVWRNLFETCGHIKSSEGSNALFVTQPLKIMNEEKGKAEEFVLNLRQGPDPPNRNYFRLKRGYRDMFLFKVFGVFA